jgi:hypothetical protein
MEDSLPKGVEGYVVPPDLGMGGGMNQLMLQAGGGKFGEVERCR